MPATDFDAERTFDDEQFVANEVFVSDRMKVVCGYFEPGQFIPVHAPDSDLAVTIHSGTGLLREGEATHRVESGDVVVEAGVDRGIRADDSEALEALLVTAPPPTETEHGPVRQGLLTGEFDPDA